MGEKFLVMPNSIGQTYYDCIILDGVEPVIFTCVDENKNLYYSVCVYNVIGEQEWFISRITPAAMCDLLSNKLTIREAATFGGKIWFAKESQNGNIEWTYKDAKEYSDDFLPTAGVYIDADNDEFNEEIHHFKHMISHTNTIVRMKVNNRKLLQTALVPNLRARSGSGHLVRSRHVTTPSRNRGKSPSAIHIAASAKTLGVRSSILSTSSKGKQRKQIVKKRG